MSSAMRLLLSDSINSPPSSPKTKALASAAMLKSLLKISGNAMLGAPFLAWCGRRLVGPCPSVCSTRYGCSPWSIELCDASYTFPHPAKCIRFMLSAQAAKPLAQQSIYICTIHSSPCSPSELCAKVSLSAHVTAIFSGTPLPSQALFR